MALRYLAFTPGGALDQEHGTWSVEHGAWERIARLHAWGIKWRRTLHGGKYEKKEGPTWSTTPSRAERRVGWRSLSRCIILLHRHIWAVARIAPGSLWLAPGPAPVVCGVLAAPEELLVAGLAVASAVDVGVFSAVLFAEVGVTGAVCNK